MRQTKESNKRAPGRVVIHISVHLVLIYTLTFSNVLLVLALNLIVHKPSYCKCSLAWCQSRTFLLFTIWTHPLQMREHPLQYVSTDKNKKSHYNWLTLPFNLSVTCPEGYSPGPTSCFRFVKELVSWNEARASCQASTQDGDLAVINSEMEQQYIMNVTQGGDWWIGKYRD